VDRPGIFEVYIEAGMGIGEYDACFSFTELIFDFSQEQLSAEKSQFTKGIHFVKLGIVDIETGIDLFEEGDSIGGTGALKNHLPVPVHPVAGNKNLSNDISGCLQDIFRQRLK